MTVTSAERVDRATTRSPRSTSGTFRALRHRDYRLLWFGQLFSAASLWMEQVVRPILVYEITHSATAVAALVFVRMLPVLLFGVVAGAIADRYDKKRILFCTQTVTFAMYLLLGLLILSGRVELWQIYATGVVAGGALAFNNPTRQAMVPRLVPADDLMNAIALNTTAGNAMRIGGGAIAGVLLIAFNIGDVYLLNAALYIVLIVMTQLIRLPKEPPKARGGSLFGSLSADLGEGFAYMRTNPVVRGLLLLAFILFVFGMPYQQVFIPLIALDQFGLDRAWAGWMLSATGVGAIFGSLYVASRQGYRRPGLALVINLLIFGGALVGLGLSRWLPLTLLLLVVSGAMSISFIALTNTLMIGSSPPEMHGRMLSLLSLDRGVIPLGAMLAGVLADRLGVGPGLMIMGAIVIALSALAISRLIPSLNGTPVQARPRRRHGLT